MAARHAALLATCAADTGVSEIERAIRAIDLRAPVARIRERSDLHEGADMQFVGEELHGARAERAV